MHETTTIRTSPRATRGRAKRWRRAAAAVALAFVVAFAPAAAEATECTVQARYQGTGWFAAYLCHGIDLISNDSCVVVDGHYYVVSVYCPEIAVVNVS